MGVILEFTIQDGNFVLGQELSGEPGVMHFELERIVPTGDSMLPFFWATGEDHEAFAKRVKADPTVQAVHELDRIGRRRLYRIEWAEIPTSLLLGIIQSDAVLLEASGDEYWIFRLRFQDHAKLSAFHNYVIEHEIPIHIERTYTMTEEIEGGHLFDLTQDQREALIIALQRGYFETPAEVTLSELAKELGVTKQSLSTRIRRGNQRILHKVLLPPVDERG